MTLRAGFVSCLLLVIAACNNHQQALTIKPVKGVKAIHPISKNNYQVICPTGICRIALNADKPLTESVFLHFYYKKIAFTKIEGAECIDRHGSTMKIFIQEPNILIITETDNRALCTLQVIDYYR